MAMGIWKGVSFVCLVAIFICLLFIKVADADIDNSGIHAVGHAVEPFCPGGYSDRGDHCQHVRHVSTLSYDEDAVAGDKYDHVKGKVSMFWSASESTMAAEEQAVELDFDSVLPGQIMDRVVVLGH